MNELFTPDEKLRTILKQYLPPIWARHLSPTIQPAETRLILAHLSALLRAVKTYIPRPVIQRRTAQPHDALVTGEFIEGTLMMADISGFTAMSEKLSTLGKEGAEEVTRAINTCFTTLLEVIQLHNGALLKFGGDALLVLFSEQNHPWAGVRAAWQMQQVMKQFARTPTSLGEFPLRISIGLNTGAFFAANIGTPTQMEYFVTGRQVNETARTEDAASAGQVFIHENTLRRLGKRVTVAQRGDRLHEVLKLTDVANSVSPILKPTVESVLRSPPAITEIQNLLVEIHALAPYIPADVLRRIISNPTSVKVEGEHRQVTVVFANVLGMTELIDVLGAANVDKITAIINHYYITMQRILERYEGTANKIDLYTKGDKLLALFGAPSMHEDDPERAVLAALEMQEAMTEICEYASDRLSAWAARQLGSCKILQQRIGINTGHVFAGNVGSGTRKEYTVMGDAVNLAARLMSATDWGNMVISRFTRQRVAGAFEFTELPAIKVKGKTAPVARYRVSGVKERDRTERQLYVQSLVGREREVALIKARMDDAVAGTGQILTLCGEAGMGKSRLVEEIADYAEELGMSYLGGDCLSFGQGIPYLPWIDVWRDHFDINENDPPDAKRHKLVAGLSQVDAELAAWAPVIGEALGTPMSDNELTASLEAKLRRQRLFDITVQLLAARAEEQPMLIVIEDVHWIDEASRELLLYAARQVSRHPIFLTIVYRPREGTEVWNELADSAAQIAIDLTELTEESAINLIRTMLGGGDIPANLRDLVIERTQGNPFYVEEVVRALVDAGVIYTADDGQWTVARELLDEVEVPDTIEGVIMSRIDRLEETTKSVLRVSSVIGRVFAYVVLEHVYPLEDLYGNLPRRLEELEKLGLTLLEHPEPDLKYIFKHILTQEVAYESILYGRRRELHRLTAQCIEELYANSLSEHYSILAHHYYEGRAWAKALRYATLAGDHAKTNYANEAAIGFYERALEIIAQGKITVPITDAAEVHESLADVLSVLGRYQESLAHLEKARAFVENADVPDNDRWFANLCWKTGAVHERKGELSQIFAWVEKGISALRSKKVVEAARLYLLNGAVLQRQGKYEQAITQCARGLEIAQEIETRAGRAETAHAYNLLSALYRQYGDNENSIEFGHRSLRIYQEIRDTPKTAHAHVHLANGYFNVSKWTKATYHYQQGLEIVEKIGDVYAQALITNNLGGVLLNQGELDRAEAVYQQSLRTWEVINSTYGIAVLHNNLGAVYIKQQRWSTALAYLQHSLRLFSQIDAEDFLPEVYRHLAEAYLGQDSLDEAMGHIQLSLEQAKAQAAKLEEGSAYRVLGQICSTQQGYSQAITAHEKSLSILNKLDAPYDVAQTQYQLARVCLQTGEIRKGRELLDRAQTAFRQLGARLDLWELEKFKQTITAPTRGAANNSLQRKGQVSAA